jgi:hypothetical protein
VFLIGKGAVGRQSREVRYSMNVITLTMSTNYAPCSEDASR